MSVPGAFDQRLLRAALADAGDANISFDRNHHVALVEQGVEVRRWNRFGPV